MDIKKSIIEVLKRSGLTQRQYASKCGFDESHISRAMRINTASGKNIKKLADGASIKASEFIRLGE